MSSFKKILWLFIGVFVFVPRVFAGSEGTSGQGQSPSGTSGQGVSGDGASFSNPLKVDSISEFFAKFLDILIQIAFPFLVLAVIYTGFLFVKAQGNPDGIKTAKTAFLYTVIGALIILAAAAISALIQGTVREITG